MSSCICAGNNCMWSKCILLTAFAANPRRLMRRPANRNNQKRREGGEARKEGTIREDTEETAREPMKATHQHHPLTLGRKGNQLTNSDLFLQFGHLLLDQLQTRLVVVIAGEDRSPGLDQQLGYRRPANIQSNGQDQRRREHRYLW